MADSRNRQAINLPDLLAQFLAPRVGDDGALTVALSGGCDSVVLLHGLACTRFASRLEAVHVNHGLSPNADAWTDFCADYCAGLGISFRQVGVVVDSDSGLGLEASARAARYAAFSDFGVKILLTAHHRSDLAETVLFNLLRGAGVTGAAGMPPERQHGEMRLLRPLLSLSRSDIEDYAQANRLKWVDDESNADTRFSRNYLRHEVMGVLSQRFPGAEAALAQAAENFGEAAALLDELAAQDWGNVAIGDAASIAGIKNLSPDRVKNLLRYRLRCLAWQVPVAARLNEFARQIVTAAPDRHPELQLPKGTMRVARGKLYWEARK